MTCLLAIITTGNYRCLYISSVATVDPYDFSKTNLRDYEKTISRLQ